MNEPVQTLLHYGRLQELADQLDSPALSLAFLENYLQMLPGRLERILRSIRDSDDKASHDAVLSLKVASSMSGALTTEAYCAELEPLVRGKQFSLALASANRLSSEVTALHATAPHILAEARKDLHRRAA